MKNKSTDPIMNSINYKDILIIFIIWYFLLGIVFSFSRAFLQSDPAVAGILQLLFITAGRLMTFAIFIIFFISLYSFSFRELGFKFKKIKSQLLPAVVLSFIFFLLIIFFINLPLSYKTLSAEFNPLIKIRNPVDLAESFYLLFFIFPSTLIISLAELFVLEKIVFGLFTYHLNKYLAAVLTALFYSILLLEFNPPGILINFILGLITVFLYLKNDKSLLSPILFLSNFYSFAIIYIYGWHYFPL